MKIDRRKSQSRSEIRVPKHQLFRTIDNLKASQSRSEIRVPKRNTARRRMDSEVSIPFRNPGSKTDYDQTHHQAKDVSIPFRNPGSKTSYQLVLHSGS